MIETLRAAIADIDNQIIALIARRTDLSAQAQVERVAAGGAWTDLAQEQRVLHRYRELGSIGHSLLEISRGMDR